MSNRIMIVVELNVTRHKPDVVFNEHDLAGWVDAAFKSTFPARTELAKKDAVLDHSGKPRPDLTISVVRSAVAIVNPTATPESSPQTTPGSDAPPASTPGKVLVP